jgi:hypothetical protein
MRLNRIENRCGVIQQFDSDRVPWKGTARRPIEETASVGQTFEASLLKASPLQPALYEDPAIMKLCASATVTKSRLSSSFRLWLVKARSPKKVDLDTLLVSARGLI